VLESVSTQLHKHLPEDYYNLILDIKHAAEWSVRTATASIRAFPDFLIVGAQKAGTTSLYAYLKQHPDIEAAWTKEICYFDHNLERGPNWYKRHFHCPWLINRDAVAGESSPNYLYYPDVPASIASLLPEVKIIILLRDPVRRAVSHYWHVRDRGFETLSLFEAVRAEKKRLQKPYGTYTPPKGKTKHRTRLDRGIYAPQLRRYFDAFPSGQILILCSRKLYQNTQGTYDRVTDFLGVPRYDLPGLGARNSRTYPDPEPELIRELRDFFEPHNQKLFEMLGRDFDW
jgi:hypothetical protein